MNSLPSSSDNEKSKENGKSKEISDVDLNTKNNNAPVVKIILSGLDNAGKSSMLIVLKKMYQFEEDLQELQPTIRIDHYRRHFLGYLLDFNDMGGQKKYRERYLQRKIYFEHVDLMIYLIDIRDIERIGESIEYLGKILEILEEFEYPKERPINITFTKMDDDQNFTELPEYIKNLAKARYEIINRYKNFKFEFFSTSIYNIYSIVRMISNALHDIIPNYRHLPEFLQKYANKYDFYHIFLFDNTGLILADYQNAGLIIGEKEPPNPNKIDQIISDNLEYFRKVEDNEDPTFQFFEREEGKFTVFGYRFQVEIPNRGKQKYYAAILVDSKNEKKYDWSINEFIDEGTNYIQEFYKS